MKKRILICIIICTPFFLKSQTNISAESDVFGEWTKKNSPYIIEGKITIPKGKILKIEPGVEVKLNAISKLDYKGFSKNNRGCIQVEGTLRAKGTSAKPIVFTRNGNAEYWGALYFKNSVDSKLDYCEFEYAGGITDLGGSNQDAFGAVSVQNCNPTFTNIKIVNCENGLYTSDNSSPIIKDSQITNCEKSAILCVEKSNPTIQYTLISKSYFGVRCEASNPAIINCNILYNQNSGIVLNQLSMPKVSNSIIWGNKYAFEVYFNIAMNQCIVQDKIAKIVTGKNKNRIRQSNIIGVPSAYPNISSLLIENNSIGLALQQNNVKGNVGIIIDSRAEVVLDEVNKEAVTKKVMLENSISDVDIDIPNTGKNYTYKYALVIGNEDYTKYQTGLNTESNVEFASHDAEIFAKYCNRVLGVPEENIVLLKDAISTQIKREIEKLSKIIMYSQGNAEIIFYYAGHGIPHETTKEAFIIPVDVAGDNIEEGIKLTWLYQKLTEYDSKMVTVFLDACFSGGARNQGLIAARGVKIKPKENMITGNCIVFSSSSDVQNSLSYNEKNHGVFTYFLLKKLKETSGNISMSELSKYLYENVALTSLKVNSMEQTPRTLVSPDLIDNWENISFIE